MDLVGYKKIKGIFPLFVLIFLSTLSAETNDHNIPTKRYCIILSGSWNSLRNERLNNDYIETWGSWGFLDDKIKSGYGFSAELLYSFFREVSIGVGLIYIGGSSNKDRVIGYAGDDSTVYHDYLKSRIYGYLLSARYYIRREKIDFSFGIGDSFLFGKVSRHHTSTRAFRGISLIENDYYSTGIGLQLFFGVLYRLTDLISYNMETGYRYFKTGDLVEKGSKLAMRSEYIIGTEPPINLDYSGPYISAGLMFRVF